MKTKEELDQLNDEQEMLEFFEEHHKTDVEMGKMAVLHAFHNYIDGIKRIYEEQTKSMTKEQIHAWQEDEEEDEDSAWATACGALCSDLEKDHNYRLSLNVDEAGVDITYHTKFFWIRFSSFITNKKPKLSEMEFEVELDDEAHFLIDLMTAIIYNHKDEDER